MPGNRLPLAVRVGCEIDSVRLLYLFAQLCQDFPLSPYRNVLGFEIVFKINSHLTFRQITHMSVRCHYLIVFSEKFLDGLYFCRGLHDHKVLRHFYRSFMSVSSDITIFKYLRNNPFLLQNTQDLLQSAQFYPALRQDFLHTFRS